MQEQLSKQEVIDEITRRLVEFCGFEAVNTLMDYRPPDMFWPLPPLPGLGGSDRLPIACAMGYFLSPWGLGQPEPLISEG